MKRMGPLEPGANAMTMMEQKELIDGTSYNYKEVDSSICDMSFDVKIYLERAYGLLFCLEYASDEKNKFIIIASQMNMNVRAHCEKYFMELMKLIKFDVGSIHCEEDGQGKNLNSSQNMLNPPRSRQKGVRSKRFKSIVEKKCDQVKRTKTKKSSTNDVACSTAGCYQIVRVSLLVTVPPCNLPSTSLLIQHLRDQGSFPSISFHSIYYFDPSNDRSVFMPMTIPPVFRQLHTDNFLVLIENARVLAVRKEFATDASRCKSYSNLGRLSLKLWNITKALGTQWESSIAGRVVMLHSKILNNLR
ncbi:hypothetical protein Cgig2_007545 [Carnegiea gigantea]|uniref:Uncharacterized protein n=1 Tax=Carnegiea gigantea TaxID=171969 RepID=A0A9Q1K5H3_9CARY|nr:hypothetical protein Cgig2_007545 [Carnegiea gigantea]